MMDHERVLARRRAVKAVREAEEYAAIVGHPPRLENAEEAQIDNYGRRGGLIRAITTGAWCVSAWCVSALWARVVTKNVGENARGKNKIKIIFNIF